MELKSSLPINERLRFGNQLGIIGRLMNRICEKFNRLVEKKEKGFVAYIGAGDPNLDLTRELTLAFDRVGVDVVELGVPFSDPLADGPVNQLAAQRGLESGTTLEGVLVQSRKSVSIARYPLYSIFITT